MNPAILEVKGLSRRFGGVNAVSNVTLSLRQGEILAVIGPNGAGKTTLLNLISGVFRPDAGQVFLQGRDITRAGADERCRQGLGRAFQTARPFPELTVMENVMVGALFGANLSLAAARARSEEVLALTSLTDAADAPAAGLSLLQDKRLEMARALATNPTVLLLDEVMAGLRPQEGLKAIELVKRVRDAGVSVLFIEHVMPVVRDLADRVVVMENGSVLAEGSYAEVTRDPRVVEAYLGRVDDAEPAQAQGASA